MDFFENELQFTKLIFKDRFYYPPEINCAIHDLVAYFRVNIVSNTPFIYLFAPNHIKTIIAYFAIVKSGHICVLVDPGIGRLELAEMKQDTPPCALVYIDRMTDTFDYGKETAITHDNPQEFDWNDLSDVCTIVYTNAEDGYAKGAMLTRINLLANAESGTDKDHLTNLSVVCGFIPFHHMFGLQTGLLTPLFAQATILIEDISTLDSLNEVLGDIFNYHATNFYSIPIIYYLLPKINNFPTLISPLTKICSGGCALSKSIANTFFLKCGKHILEGYGLTECSPVCTFTDYFFNAPAGFVGTALSCNQIRIKKDINNTGSPSDSGEICIKGKNVFKGYFGKLEMNQLVLKDNWFTSGDYGKIDQYGNLYITGRKKNMINIGSKKVYPKHAERLISLHENVRNISISMTSHPVLTEIAHATVELMEKGERKESTFKKWCLSNFSNHLVPKRISFL